MLTFGVLFSAIGFILVLFNTVSFRFVKDQVKDKKQAIAGYISLTIGVVLLIISISNMMK
ncbi:hypothetical protein [Urechidicola croceus]|uniref:Uncharacterized protein n=1 Tax=Urechidicola croceus TaxID=1850246 RepID=A0A1D8P8H9_9FLAO|nr:hypothetical protein [Urechidicola croceus]AOW20875.1 hypothetical protein LPB138_09415 [Urechidicola croceus]